MKNQIMEQFKVVELEQRLEMKSEWSLGLKGDKNGISGSATLTIK